MTALIKHSVAPGAVATLPAARRDRSPAIPDEPSPPDPRLAALEAEVARLDRVLAEQRQDAARAIETARREGRAEAVAEDERRVAKVERGVADALLAWAERLESLDRLAVELARGGLAKIFGDDADRIAQVGQTIAHHLGTLADDAVVAVRVSGEDFDAAALDGLARRLDFGRSRLIADRDLGPGGCRIDLRLGAIDLAPEQQWAIIDRALATMGAA